MTKYSNNNPPTSNCFTGILQMFICAGNLPTHTSQHGQILEKPEKLRSFSSNVDNGSVQGHVQAQNSGPGIIARLMGLDSLPNYNKNEENNKITTLDSLFRSKSMNSLHFLPDFDPTRVAFHRRARTTSASFHEQGRVNYNFVVVKDDDRVDKDTKGEKEAGSKSNNEICMFKKNRHDSDGKRVKERKSKKRYEERYYKTNSREFRNNVGENSNLLREKLVKKKGKLNGKVVTSKKKVYHKEIMCFEDDQLPSRSPVSVLDDYYKEFEFFTISKGEGRQAKSNSRRKTSPNIKINDNLRQEIMPKSKENQQDYCNKIATKQELVKEEVDAADYLVELLGKICKLAEEEYKKDSNWKTKYELWKMQFVEEVSIHLGQELLDLLLDQLVEEIVMLSL